LIAMLRLARLALLTVLLALAAPAPGRAEVHELRISRGYGIHFLPMFVMEQQKLLEKHAAAAGLGAVTVSWHAIDGGNQINDAMLSGALDIATLGVPGFLVLWDKAKGNARLEVAGIAALSAGSMWVNSRVPETKTLADFTERDRIALPGIKTSYAAVVLQMLAAQAFGAANYAKLDPLTVGLPYPEAVAALTSGKTEITAHVASPPFNYIELDHPGIHRIVSSGDVLGALPVIMAHTTRRFHDANPKLIAAFLAALDEACRFVTDDKPGAAKIYAAAANVKTSDALVLRILQDPENRFSITPVGMMKIAAFMHQVGSLKAQPASWKDLFFPEIHNLPGS
jgi:NitT/TauT family transport system substrate-binding protein